MTTDFLRQMAENIRTQDNAITSDPIFCVQTLRREYGYDSDYTDDSVWCDMCNDNVYATEEEEALLEEETHPRQGDFRRVGYKDAWENVQPFFTRAGAERYIEENAHNLKQPRIYVDSAYRNREWQAVRELLKAMEVTT